MDVYSGSVNQVVNFEFIASTELSSCPSYLFTYHTPNRYCQTIQKVIAVTSIAMPFPLSLDYSKFPEGITLRYWHRSAALSQNGYFIAQD